jgi:hypothetical protein
MRKNAKMQKNAGYNVYQKRVVHDGMQWCGTAAAEEFCLWRFDARYYVAL